jgi:hypothetical protein
MRYNGYDRKIYKYSMIKNVYTYWSGVNYKVAEKLLSPFPSISTMIINFYVVTALVLSLNYLLYLDKYLELVWFFIFSVIASVFLVVFFYFKCEKEILEIKSNYKLKFYVVVLSFLQIFISSWIIANIIKNLGDRNGIMLL